MQGVLPPVNDKDSNSNSIGIAPQVAIETTVYSSDSSYQQVPQHYPPYVVGGKQANSNLSYMQPGATGYSETSSISSDGSQPFVNGSGTSIACGGNEAVSNSSQPLSHQHYPVASGVGSGQSHSGIEPVAVANGFPSQDGGVVGNVAPASSAPLSDSLVVPRKKSNHHVPTQIPVQGQPMIKMPDAPPEGQPNRSQSGMLNQDATNLPARGGQHMYYVQSGYQMPPGQYHSQLMMQQPIPQGQAPAPMNVSSAVSRAPQQQQQQQQQQQPPPVAPIPQAAPGVIPESIRLSQLAQQPPPPAAYPAGAHLYNHNGGLAQAPPAINPIHSTNSIPHGNGVASSATSGLHSQLPGPPNNSGGLYHTTSHTSVSAIDEQNTVMKCLVHYGVTQMRYTDKEWDITRSKLILLSAALPIV